MIIISSNLNWSKDYWNGILEADARGYYAYLPAIFIYQDLNYDFWDTVEKEKSPSHYIYEYRNTVNGKVINKYYCGTAIAQTPFFLIAHFLSNLCDRDADGYTSFYPISISIAALFYLIIGLIFISKTLTTYKISESNKSITLIAAVFGTNLFYYALVEPGMSHIYSFAFTALFVYLGRLYFQRFSKYDLLSLGLILGIITLIRPVNVLILLTLPFLSGNSNNLQKGIKELMRNKFYFCLSSLGFLGILSIQLIIYKLSTGSFWAYSYNGETFNFTDPHFIEILFSYKKGLFLYTPTYLICLLGMVVIYKRNKFEFYSLTIFFIAITYVFSSWWMWYYGGSFSSRVYVELIPLFVISLAILLNSKMTEIAKIAINAILALLIIVCQIQTYQYRYEQIHWSEMNKEKYWDSFLRIDKLIQ